MTQKKILVVDDDQELLGLVEKRLAGEGYGVITSSEGSDAIEKARGMAPDLILADIVLPDMEGSEAVRILAEDPLTKNIPVIFISGIVAPEGDKMPSEVCVAGRLYKALGKPFVSVDLMRIIRETIG